MKREPPRAAAPDAEAQGIHALEGVEEVKVPFTDFTVREEIDVLE